MKYSDGAIDGIIDRIQRTNYDHYDYNCYSIAGNARLLARDLGAGDARGSYTGDVADRVAELLTACRGEIDRLRARALPDWVKWPRFADGAPVGIGDFIVHEGRSETVSGVRLYAGCCELAMVGRDHELRRTVWPGETVERPAIEAADGLPIEVGHTLYGENGRGWRVTVLLHERRGYAPRYSVEAVAADGSGDRRELKPCWLTHERPDSWDRLEADAADEAQRELVRRARALAEGGRHE